MVEGRCETCKWWEENDEYAPGTGTCTLAHGSDTGTPEHPQSLAYVIGGYGAWLHTKKDFGCVQWEAMPVAGITCDAPLLISTDQSGTEATLFLDPYPGGSVIIGDDDGLRSYEEAAAQDTRDGKMQAHRIAMNRRRFFHRRAP